MFMPDVNTLIAAAWPNHVHHRLVRAWFLEAADDRWATCPLVHTGFIRVSMNPRVVGRDVTFSEALYALTRYTEDPGHTFWAMESPANWPASMRDRIQGYRQVTDAALLATAIANEGRLATLNGGITSLLPGDSRDHVVVIGPR